jgi:hypothetical protein
MAPPPPIRRPGKPLPPANTHTSMITKCRWRISRPPICTERRLFEHWPSTRVDHAAWPVLCVAGPPDRLIARVPDQGWSVAVRPSARRSVHVLCPMVRLPCSR